MHYINTLTSAFEKMKDYMNMYRVVVVNDLFYDFTGLAQDGIIWNAQWALEYFRADNDCS